MEEVRGFRFPARKDLARVRILDLEPAIRLRAMDHDFASGELRQGNRVLIGVGMVEASIKLSSRLPVATQQKSLRAEDLVDRRVRTAGGNDRAIKPVCVVN